MNTEHTEIAVSHPSFGAQSRRIDHFDPETGTATEVKSGKGKIDITQFDDYVTMVREKVEVEVKIGKEKQKREVEKVVYVLLDPDLDGKAENLKFLHKQIGKVKDVVVEVKIYKGDGTIYTMTRKNDGQKTFGDLKKELQP